MSRTPLGIEIVLKVNTVLEDWIILSPILVAVLKDLTDISLKICPRSIVVSVHLGLDSAQVHGPLDDIEIIGDVVDSGINGVLEGADKASPKARTLEHALDEVTAEFHLLLRCERNHLASDLTGSAAVVAGTAVWLGFASGLLGWRRLYLDWFITKWESCCRSGDFGFATALGCGSWLLNVNLGGAELKVVLLCLRSVGRCSGEITHNNDELAEDLLRQGLGKRVANLRRGTHFSSQQRSSWCCEYTYCAQLPNR